MPSIQANGLSFEYESLGDPAHPAIVLVMGLGVQMILWPDELCAMLVERGFRVVRFDNRDVGCSSSLDALGVPRINVAYLRFLLHLRLKAPYTLDDMARDTAAVTAALGIERAHFVGASMGGMIVQNLAAQFPERIATLTSIMSTTGKRSLPGPTLRARRALMQPPARPGDFEGAVHRFMNVLRVIGSRTHPSSDARLRDLAERHVRRGLNPAGQARQLMAIAAAGDRSHVVRRIRAPALVIHGNEDPLLKPACGIETARVLREAGVATELDIVEGMGHDLPLPLLPRIAEKIAAHCSR